MSICFADATLLDASGRRRGWLLASDGVISRTGEGKPPGGAHRTIDLAGATLTPGFIDLHCHGGGGASYDHADPAAVRRGLSTHAGHGTTTSLLSLVSSPIEGLTATLLAAARLADPGLLGVHLEGPFLAPSRCGAHRPDFLSTPDPSQVARLIEAGDGVLRQVTLAPELPGAMAAIKQFSEAGVLVAVGHTEADEGVTQAAIDAGARLLTHAFNAMPPVAGRQPGPLGAALADDRMIVEVIADGQHVNPVNLNWLFRAAPGRVALITDAMAAAGAHDGDYRLGTLDVEVRQGRACLAGTDRLAGSTLTQDEALRIVVRAGVDPASAVGALTATPARALGLTDVGSLAPGCRADLVAFDASWEVCGVWRGGHPVIPASVG